MLVTLIVVVSPYGLYSTSVMLTFQEVFGFTMNFVSLLYLAANDESPLYLTSTSCSPPANPLMFPNIASPSVTFTVPTGLPST